MAAGRRPFIGESGQAVWNEILNEDPQNPSSLEPGIPSGLEDIIPRCLRKSVVERFPDFNRLLEALEGEKVRRTDSAADPRLTRKAGARGHLPQHLYGISRAGAGRPPAFFGDPRPSRPAALSRQIRDTHRGCTQCLTRLPVGAMLLPSCRKGNKDYEMPQR